MVKVGMSIAKKRKVGTTLKESLLKRLKLQAVEENRPIADVISDAIEQYLALRQAEDECSTISPKLLINHL
jgi:predicted transcriptional regulator